MKRSLPMVALCVGLLGGAVVGSSCGPAKVACTPTNCSGCCDGSTGACVQIGTAQACGRNAEVCKPCSLGFVCSFGSCTSGNTGAGESGGGFTSGGGTAGGGSAGGGSVGGGSVGGGSVGGGNVGGGSVGGGNVGGGSVGGGNVAGGSVGGGSVGGGNVAGGVPGCNSATCSSGCCQGTTCVAPPNNGLNTTCGFAGFACTDCTASGQVCNTTSFTCVPGSGGGSAGGGGAGGGAPNGDSCSNPTTLTLFNGSASTSGTISGYANDSTQCSGAGPDAVYMVTVPTGTLSAQVFATGFTPRINVRSTCTGTALVCDSNPVSGVAQVSTTLSAGTYFLWIDSSLSGASGSYSLSVTSTGSAGGGSAGGGSAGGGSAGGGSAGGGVGEGCSDAIRLTGSTSVSGTTVGATNDVATPGTTSVCTGFSNTGPDRVYSVVVPSGWTLDATVTPSGTSWDAAIYLISPSVCGTAVSGCLSALGTGDEGSTGSETVTYTNPGAGDQTVLIVVDGYQAAANGAYTLDVVIGP